MQAVEVAARANAPAVSKQTPLAKSSPSMLKISLGLSCNYACEYCSQRFVPRADETNPRYKACFACTTAQAFAKTLAQAGYATDPAYADKVIGLIKQHNLLSLDGGAA